MDFAISDATIADWPDELLGAQLPGPRPKMTASALTASRPLNLSWDQHEANSK